MSLGRLLIPIVGHKVASRKPYYGEQIFSGGVIKTAPRGIIGDWLIVEKIKPRRIVLEETDEVRPPKHGEFYVTRSNAIQQCEIYNSNISGKIWRVVNEE